jgi:predicted DCC family thiol-disulfide oxidoreductase YuxK
MTWCPFFVEVFLSIQKVLTYKEISMDPHAYPLEFLYDGHCRICLFDVARLRRADRDGRLRFVDVMAEDFDPAAYGHDRQELLDRIHARRADGGMVEGPEVFRLALAAVGYGWLAAPTRWPVLRQVSELAYRAFARHRVALSRRFGGIFARLTPRCDTTSCQR